MVENMQPVRPQRRAHELVLLVGAVLLLAGACGNDDTSAEDAQADGATTTTLGEPDRGEPEAGGTLRFGLVAETSGWDPTKDQFTLSGYQVATAIYDRMVAYDENRQWQPYVVEDLVPNDDFTEWTFTTRDGVRFHDGTDLDAEALRANLQGTKDSALLGQVFAAVDTITTTDDRTVVVAMSEPWSSFPHTLTAQPGLVVAPSYLADGGDPIGTGPFRFVSWDRDDSLVTERNDDYWRTGYPLLDAIEFEILGDRTARAAAFETDQVDVIEIREGQLVADLRAGADADRRVMLDQDGETTESLLMLNTGAPPFDDPAARQVVALGIDRQLVSDTLFAGEFPVANGPFKDGSPWNTGVAFPNYDPGAAAEAAATYAAETGAPLSFEITAAPTGTGNDLAELLVQMMAEYDVEVTVRSVEGTAAIVNTLLGDFDVVTTDALFGSTHPDREVTFLRGENALPVGEMATNFTRLSSPELDAALAEAHRTDDPAAEADAWREIQEVLAAENSWVFLVHIEVGVAAHVDVADLRTWTLPDGEPGLPQEQNVVSLYQVWLDR